MVSLLLIVKDNKFLLVKRSPNDDYHPNQWALPGGTMEKGETPEQTLNREIDEELGITISGYNPLGKYNDGEYIMYVYYLDSPDFDESSITLNEEHTEYKFFNFYEIQELNNILKSSVKFIVDYLKKSN